MTDTHVYKLLSQADWAAAEASGITAVPLDVADGYVHLSGIATVSETARLYYSGRVIVHLLEFAVADLPTLRWEPSRGGTLFPHLYGDLHIAAACRQWQLSPDADGAPRMPDDL